MAILSQQVSGLVSRRCHDEGIMLKSAAPGSTAVLQRGRGRGAATVRGRMFGGNVSS